MVGREGVEPCDGRRFFVSTARSTASRPAEERRRHHLHARAAALALLLKMRRIAAGGSTGGSIISTAKAKRALDVPFATKVKARQEAQARSFERQAHAAQAAAAQAASADDEKQRKHRENVQSTQTEALTRILRASEKDYRSILSVDRYAALTTAEITKAFRRQSLLVHPDKNSDPKAEEGFKKLQAAYAALKEEVGRPAAPRPTYSAPSAAPSSSYYATGGGSGASSAYDRGETYYSSEPRGYYAGSSGAGSGTSRGGGPQYSRGTHGAGSGRYAWGSEQAPGPAGYAPGSAGYGSSYGSAWARSERERSERHQSSTPPWGSDRDARDEFYKWTSRSGGSYSQRSPKNR